MTPSLCLSLQGSGQLVELDIGPWFPGSLSKRQNKMPDHGAISPVTEEPGGPCLCSGCSGDLKKELSCKEAGRCVEGTGAV